MDFGALESLPELKEGKIGAICCSRPTNPTGNVLTDGEMARFGRVGAGTRDSADYRQRLRNAVPEYYLQRCDAQLARKHHPLLQPF